ncbi:MAG TPA: hypothetical protein VMZ53_19095 [Kofleriaceae bacterium]|nr:hypothetical protein [Kofleriaceae bacterium]
MVGLRAIGIAMVVVIAGAGCLAFDDVQCADGHLCPPGSRCDDVHGGCILPSQLQACVGIPDGGDCQIDGADGACRNGACVAFTCGDGLRDGVEPCEGDDFGGMTCTDFGFTNPDGLACTDDCHINKDNCTGGCGDNIKDQTELCDGTDIPAATTCQTLGFYDAAGLECSPFCTFDVAKCTGFCGDGAQNGPEQCDAFAPAGQTCLDYSFDGGRLGCTLCAPGFEGCTSFGWKRIQSPATQRLRGIWGTSSSNFYIVGLAGTLLRYNGSQLSTVVPAPTTQDLNAVWGSDASNIFAVGASGTILRFDGSAWTSTTSGSALLLGVWGSSANDVYAVGSGGTVLHYAGSWAPVMGTGAGTNDLRAVWGIGSHVFAVGTSGTVLHYDSGTWTATAIAGSPDLFGVWGTSATNVYASGTTATSNTAVYRFDGFTWTLVYQGGQGGRFNAVWAASATDAFAVGTAIGHFDGSKWSPLLLPSDVSAGTRLWGVWGSPTGDVWAIGDAGYVARWGGASWTVPQVTPATTVSFRGVSTWGSSDAFAVGLGAIARYDGASWTITNTTSATDQLYGVWAASQSFAVAVGETSTSSAGIIYHFDGNSWINLPSGDSRNCGGLPSFGLRSVWGSSTSNIYSVGGGTSGIFRRFATCWSAPTAQPSGAMQLFGIHGTSATNAFAASVGGLVYAFDGASWTSLPTPPTTSFLITVWTSGANDLFAVGDAILHYDGTNWARMSANGQNLGGVSGTGPRNVFAVGNNSRLLHYDGISWTPMRVPTSIASTYLRSVSATQRSLLVVGDNGFMQRLAFSQRSSEVNCRDAWDDDADGMPDCADTDCAADAYCKRGGACSVIRDVTCGQTITGSTLGATPGRDYYTCDSNAETGPEAIYRLVPPATGTATATLSAFAPAELDLVVVGAMPSTDACDPDINCDGASSTDGTATEAVTFGTTMNRPEFIIVEGRNAAAGPFTLKVTCQ